MADFSTNALRSFQNYNSGLGQNFDANQRVVVGNNNAPVARSGDAGAVSRFFNLSNAAKASRAENNAARTAFLRAVVGEFGGLKAVPESVLKAMNLDKFGMVENNGELTASSGKPLTQRRINAVMTAVVAAKNEMERNIHELIASDTMVGDMLRQAPFDSRKDMAMTALALQAHGVDLFDPGSSEMLLIKNPKIIRDFQPEGDITSETIDRYVNAKLDKYELDAYQGCFGANRQHFGKSLSCAIAIDIYERKAAAGTLGNEKYIFKSRDEVSDYNEEFYEPFDVLLEGSAHHVVNLVDSGFKFDALIEGRKEVSEGAFFYAPSHVARFSSQQIQNFIAGDAERTSISVDFKLDDSEQLNGSFDAHTYKDDRLRETAAKAFASNIEHAVRKFLGLGDNEELNIQAKTTMLVMMQAALNPVRNYFGGASEHDACQISFQKNDGMVIAHLRNSEKSATKFDYKIEIDPDGANRLVDVTLG